MSGIFADRQALQRHQAEDDQQQADDGREDRPADRQLGDAHVRNSASAVWPASARCSRTALPSRTFCVPSTTTRSCSFRPATISTSPGRRLPSFTSRRSRDAVLDDEHERTALLRHDRRLRARAASASTSPCSVTVMNMPGRSTPSWFGISARTAIERVTGSTRESRLADLALELPARQPGGRRRDRQALARARRDRSPAR